MREQRNAQLDLEHDVTAPRAARRFLTTVLAEWGVGESIIERTLLLASELVSNAVLHADGSIQLRVGQQGTAPDVIRIEVTNGGEGQPVMRRAKRGDLSGRGLQLIDELARGWGTESSDGHTFVWFEIA